MASLTRAGLEPGLLARTTLHFGEEHFPVELTIDTRGEDAGFIDFAHDTRDTRSPERIWYRIWLSWSKPNFGGQRYWFCCPGTGKLQRHHQSGLLRRAAPARQLQGEGAVPAESGRPPMLDGFAGRLPDQGSIGEDPERSRRLAFQERASRGVVLRLGEVVSPWLRARVRLQSLAACDQLGGERHRGF
jgi:hypothetical protein